MAFHPSAGAKLLPDKEMLDQTIHVLLAGQPTEKVRLLIEIGNNLSKTLELQTLLPRIADSLFQLFPQADSCFLIERGEGERLLPRLVKTRRGSDEGTAQFSRFMVRKCLESSLAYVSGRAKVSFEDLQSEIDFYNSPKRSLMAAPLMRADGKPFGVIQLDLLHRSREFTQEDLKLLCASLILLFDALVSAAFLGTQGEPSLGEKRPDLAEDETVPF
jgi:sigma-B regulation protein RsbU (phosphoserine phosphatase)